MPILPVPRSLYLCDSYAGRHDKKVDLFGLFNAIQSPSGFPYVCPRLCVFAQLVNGIGKVPFSIALRIPMQEDPLFFTKTRMLDFPSRTTLVHLALTIEGCRFEHPGVYLIELFCDNDWVCDTELLLS